MRINVNIFYFLFHGFVKIFVKEYNLMQIGINQQRIIGIKDIKNNIFGSKILIY